MNEYKMDGLVEHPGHPDQSVHGRRGRSSSVRMDVWPNGKKKALVVSVRKRVGTGKLFAKSYKVRAGVAQRVAGRLQKMSKARSEAHKATGQYQLNVDSPGKHYSYTK
jgi:hypothetical protein